MIPLDRIYITQRFGDNPSYYAQFGFKGHEGLDFRTKWDDSPDGKRKCRTICDGKAFIRDEGAYGKHIIVQDILGNQFYYCHLSEFLVKDGQIVKRGEWIGITGESGNTQGAHLHFCVKPYKPDLNNGFKGFIDPLDYVKKLLEIRMVNYEELDWEGLMTDIRMFSHGLIEVMFNLSDIPINVQSGMLTQEKAYEFVEKYNLDDRFLMLCYPKNATSSFLATFTYPKRNMVISTIPTPAETRGMCFEFAHQVQMFYNGNRPLGAKPVQIEDSMFPTDELIVSKYLSIAPYLDVLDDTYPTINEMYSLIRHPEKFDEVYALKDKVVRHIVNLETLKQGDKEPDRLWVWGGVDIPQATADVWATYTEEAEILLLPKDK